MLPSKLNEGNIFNYNYFLQPNVCRFCWSLNADINFRGERNHGEEKTNNLLSLIQELLSIHLVEVKGPDKLCGTCHSQIENYNQFKTFCQESERKLRNILDNEIKTEETVESPVIFKEEYELNLDYNTNLGKEYLSDDSLDLAVAEEKVPRKKEKSKKSLVCKSCDLYFSSKVELRLHTSLEHKNNCKQKKLDNFCNLCKVSFSSAAELNLHNSEAHGVETGLYKCYGCNKTFKSNRLRCRHELNFCKGLKDGYKCDVCIRFLPTRKSYEVHIRNHRHNIETKLPDNLFKCYKCEECFKTRELLMSHHEAIHNMMKKIFVCETCGRSFNRSDYLNKHRLTHSGVKNHKCKYCPFMATQRSSILVHMRRHTGERPFSCHICSQRCVSSSNLKVHMRRHLGTDKFECSLCDKKFRYKSSLEEHIGSSHDRPQCHVCTECGATYSRIRGLRRHVAAKHGKQAKVTSEIEKNDMDFYDKMVTESVHCVMRSTSDVMNKSDILC